MIDKKIVTKIIIAGGRDFDNYDLLDETANDIMLAINTKLEVVSGGAKGADELGERFAKEVKQPIKLFPANWDLHGKSAGYIRNSEMAKYADVLIAYWDGKSRGTKHMIDTAKKEGLEVHVIKYDK